MLFPFVALAGFAILLVVAATLALFLGEMAFVAVATGFVVVGLVADAIVRRIRSP